MLTKAVLTAWQQDPWCSPGDRLLLALSGGLDSMVLLDVLWRLQHALGIDLQAAHLDHALRAASVRDARMVKAVCEQYRIPLVCHRWQHPPLFAPQGLEAAARHKRYQFLRQVAQEHHCSRILLAHHQQDQAETLLYRLLRGSGSRGLQGMRLCGDPFVRPMLNISRADLVAYAQQRRLPWVQDLSNWQPAFARNRIRHFLLPSLEQEQPQIVSVLARLSRQMAVDEEYWCQQVRHLRHEYVARTAAGELHCSRQGIGQLHPALRQRLWLSLLEEVRGQVGGVTSQHIEQLEEVVTSTRPQGRRDLAGCRVVWSYDSLALGKAGFGAEQQTQMEPLEIDGPAMVCLGSGWYLSVAWQRAPVAESWDRIALGCSSACWPLVIRCRRPGDILAPQGMQGRQKLKDFFINRKLPSIVRQRWPLLMAGSELIWVIGLRRSRYWPQSEEGWVLTVSLHHSSRLLFSCESPGFMLDFSRPNST